MSFFLSPQHWQEVRHNKVLSWLDGDILELGCGGTGIIPKLLKEKNGSHKYVGIDFGEENILRLKNEYPEYNFLCKNLDNTLTIEGLEVDTLISIATIEHLYNQGIFFESALKHLKKGGKFIITTPTNFGNDIIYPIICKMGFRKKGSALLDHITIYNKDRFKVVAQDFNLEIIHFEKFELFCNQMIVFKKN